MKGAHSEMDSTKKFEESSPLSASEKEMVLFTEYVTNAELYGEDAEVTVASRQRWIWQSRENDGDHSGSTNTKEAI